MFDIAFVVGEPARAKMLAALMDGRALTATELALEANVAPSTASTHLAKLEGAGLVAVEKQGRHRYFRIAESEVADVLEQLMGLSTSKRVRTGPSNPALRNLRVCYDHLAGERAVALFDALRARRRLVERNGTLTLSPSGRTAFASLGIDLTTLPRTRRPLCRPCLDWSERRNHLGGALGAALLERLLAKRWARREAASRVITLTGEGERRLREL